MRVKMLNSRVGANETFDGGSEYDLPYARAERWVNAGFAELVAGVVPAVVEREDAIELAVKPVPVETAVKRGRRR